jgi:DNA-binding response OmpR family regulator
LNSTRKEDAPPSCIPIAQIEPEQPQIEGEIMRGAIVTVLAILPCPDDQIALKEIFSHSKWNLHLVERLELARSLLNEFAAGIVISDDRLPDARWQDVLLELQCRRVEPVLIVVSRLADDELWAEVLNLGGYDLLATPLQATEVIRSVPLAWRHWQDRLRAREQPGKVMTASSRAWRSPI